MTKKEHATALKNNMEGQIAQYEMRIAYEKTRSGSFDDEEENAKHEMKIDNYQEELEKIKSDYEPFISFIEENYGEDE